MSITTDDHGAADDVELIEAGGREQLLAPGEHAHPSDLVYIVVALVLAALTAIEVALYYVHAGLTYIPLLILMLLKFLIVAGFFMHLRFDSKVFRRFFAGGIILAIFCYCSVLLMFGVLHV